MLNFLSRNRPYRTLRWIHRLAGWIALPFLTLSLLIALGLTHGSALHALSEALFDSLPISPVTLDEPVKPDSWDQALKLAGMAHGGTGRVITTRGPHRLEVGGFSSRHDHGKTDRSMPTLYLIDSASMRILRTEGGRNSLFLMAHGMHAFRFFGVDWLSVAAITSFSLVTLLVSGLMIGAVDGKLGKRYSGASRLHLLLGRIVSLPVLVIVLTTLHLEYPMIRNASSTSHPIPQGLLTSAPTMGSLDQARQLAAQVIGRPPEGAFIRGDNMIKFSEAGDGIGGLSVVVNAATLSVQKITDWRNDFSTLVFVLHDGRWLGGMNAFNVNDAAALVLAFLAVSGLWIGRRRRGTKDGQRR